MKKILFLPIALVIILFFASCDGKEKSFDETLLPGKWQDGTIHEYYAEDGTGYTWDTADDVTEDEAQPYTWELTGEKLRQYHQGEMGTVVPKTYTVTELTTSSLKYHDAYDKSYSFSKIK